MSSGGSMSWDLTDMLGKTTKLHPVLEKGLTAITERVAVDSQDFARMNAHWTDRTGNARNGLFGKPISEPGKHTVVVYHTVSYGIWLEVRWSGALGVIDETIQVNGQKAMRYANGLLSRLAS